MIRLTESYVKHYNGDPEVKYVEGFDNNFVGELNGNKFNATFVNSFGLDSSINGNYRCVLGFVYIFWGVAHGYVQYPKGAPYAGAGIHIGKKIVMFMPGLGASLFNRCWLFVSAKLTKE